MNARIRIVTRISVYPFVVSPIDTSSMGFGNWRKFQRTLGRMRLLLGSPIASFRWAMAKRWAASRKKKTNQSSRVSNFAQYERDGIVMGF